MQVDLPLLIYLPWAWQKVQGRWKGLVELIYWLPHHKQQPGHLSHGTAPPLLTAPTARHHSCRNTHVKDILKRYGRDKGYLTKEWRIMSDKWEWVDILFLCLYVVCTSKHHCLWRREMTWWPQGPSRSRCLPLTFLWFYATPWPGRNLWSSRSSSRCRHSRLFQVIKLKRHITSGVMEETEKAELGRKIKICDTSVMSWKSGKTGLDRMKVSDMRGIEGERGREVQRVGERQPHRWGDDSRYSTGACGMQVIYYCRNRGLTAPQSTCLQVLELLNTLKTAGILQPCL